MLLDYDDGVIKKKKCHVAINQQNGQDKIHGVVYYFVWWSKTNVRPIPLRRREGETATLRKWVKDREPFPFPICLSNCFVSRHSVVPRASLLPSSPKIDLCKTYVYGVSGTPGAPYNRSDESLSSFTWFTRLRTHGCFRNTRCRTRELVHTVTFDISWIS